MKPVIAYKQSREPTPKRIAKLLRSAILASCLASSLATSLSAQEAWYKIELSIFSNEALADREQEKWQADRNTLDYPDDITRLKLLGDLLLLDSMLPEPPIEVETLTFESPQLEFLQPNPSEVLSNPAPLSKAELRAESIAKVGPFPTNDDASFKFFDFERDAFLSLPDSLSDFTQTNRALRRSPDHRLLYHAVWHQAVPAENEAKAILIEAGERYGDQPELQGSLTIRFNDNADRVVLDADIWLAEFVLASSNLGPAQLGRANDAEQDIEKPWQLPALPSAITDGPLQILQRRLQTADSAYQIKNVFHMLQSRAMRSNEFHYIDHPALGIVVQVEPYEVPALPESEAAGDIGLDYTLENEASLSPADDLPPSGDSGN